MITCGADLNDIKSHSKSFSCNSPLEAFHGIERENVWQHGMRLKCCRNEVQYTTPDPNSVFSTGFAHLYLL